MGYTEPWFDIVVESGVTPDLPGIYEWRIDGVGSYIGKYTYSRRPLKEYSRHVRSQFEGGHYRPQNKDGWRRIHRELYQACLEGRKVTLVFVENCALSTLNERERAHIRDRGTLNGARLVGASPSTLPSMAFQTGEAVENSELRAIAKRLAFYQRLVSQFETSRSLLDAAPQGHSLSHEFFSDIRHLMNLHDDDLTETLFDLLIEEIDQQADFFDAEAKKLAP
ncbi:MAG: hypothetical protein V7704_08340 [Aurantimonas endophytica]|uniref:hypothetical protein n=1 Tax=Aurantimonas endophytica TaxID=1522175 RepID=UPI003001E9EF